MMVVGLGTNWIIHLNTFGKASGIHWQIRLLFFIYLGLDFRFPSPGWFVLEV